MATNEMQGREALFEIKRNGQWKVMVCEIDHDFGGSADISEEQTKCGTIKTPNEISMDASGSAVVNAIPGDMEVSYMDVWEMFQNNEEVEFRVSSPAVLTLGAGDAFFHQGKGYFSEVRHTNTVGESIKFNWSFSVNGNVTNMMAPENIEVTEDEQVASVAFDAVTRATGYVAQAATNSTFTIGLKTGTGATSPVSITGLTASTLYYFRVKATKTGSEDSDWSETETLTTEAP